MKVGYAGLAAPKPQSRVNVSLHPGHGKYMPTVKVGAPYAMRVQGTVTDMHSGKYGHGFDLDMDTLDHDTDKDREAGEPRSLSQAMRMYHAGRRVKA